jgi:tetratricopeptide (TPR) repeat protein
MSSLSRGRDNATVSPEAAEYVGSMRDAERIGSSDRQQSAYHSAQRLKEEGNKLHGQKQYAKAALKYELAANVLQPEPHPVGDLLPELEELLTICRGNLASCYLQLCLWQECEEECNKVLLGDPAHCKALYRRVQAFSALGKHAEAIADLEKVVLHSSVFDQPPIQEKLNEARLREKLPAAGSDEIYRQSMEMYNHFEEATSRQRSLAKALEGRADMLEEMERVIRDENRYLPGTGNTLTMDSSALRNRAKLLRKRAAEQEVLLPMGMPAPVLSDGVPMYPAEMLDLAKMFEEMADDRDALEEN